MSISTAGHRKFPALLIVCVLGLVCLALGQFGQPWMAHHLPGVAGVLKGNAGFVVLDLPVHLPQPIDLVLLPALFVLMYVAVILLWDRPEVSRWRQVRFRLRAIGAAVVIITCCVAVGSLLSFLLHDHLPKSVNETLGSIGINADLYLTTKTISLHGNVLVMLALLIGMVLAAGRINRSPRIRRLAPLTREQRMTPYQRMLRERPLPRKDGSRCSAQPLLTLQPEAVNYRPLA